MLEFVNIFEVEAIDAFVPLGVYGGVHTYQEALCVAKTVVKEKEVSLICAVDRLSPISRGYLAIDPLAKSVGLETSTVVEYLKETADSVRTVFKAPVSVNGEVKNYYFMPMMRENLTKILTDLGKGDTPEAHIGDLSNVLIFSSLTKTRDEVFKRGYDPDEYEAENAA